MLYLCQEILKKCTEMEAVVEIDTQTLQAKKFIKYARTLPYAKVREAKKKNYKEACVDCDAVTVDAFFDELNARIEKWPDHA
jgi:DNA repair protein RadC